MYEAKIFKTNQSIETRIKNCQIIVISLFNYIFPNYASKLLVWCGNCDVADAMLNFSGSVEDGEGRPA